jgi:HD superfamily phosphohydrolase
MVGSLRDRVRQTAPNLISDVDALTSEWLQKLLDKIRGSAPLEFRPKQVNDPVWGTVELLPWEVALLDTPLLQRMRGVRQLGLAQLVFPGASHGRLEHIIGVVGAIEEATRALSRQIDRWNRNNKHQQIPPITDGDRHAIRLAGLLHDVGHGPFSHALEPVLEIDAPLGSISTSTDKWRPELKAMRELLSESYALNKPPSASETLAVAIVFSNAMHEVLASDKVITERATDAQSLEETITAAIVGAVGGPGSSYLSGLVSSQVDADRLDYLARDTHHAGLRIGFDTDRLLAKLEVLRIREDNLEPSAIELRERASRSAEGTFLQLGIAASGFGSFEQMLIGRTFLYDRVYHHHKVRSAEAMAQRLMLVAERDRKRRFDLREIFLSVDDETMLRIFAREVTHSVIDVNSDAAAALARGILDRDLLHRAYAFRGRFISLPRGTDIEAADQTQNMLWGRIVKELDGLKPRYDLGAEIHELARRCSRTIKEAGVAVADMTRFSDILESGGPEQVIVDLPSSKTEGIRILARYPNGAIRVPEFSFNPQKWADAYDLQKRTGYVFCPREIAPIIGLASKIVFLVRFGVNMIKEADGYIKAAAASQSWIKPLVDAQVIDLDAAELLTSKRHSLISVREEDLQLPQEWLNEDPDLATRLSVDIQASLKGGLTAEHMKALGDVLAGMYRFVDVWFDSNKVTSVLAGEDSLQSQLREALAMRGLKIDEGSRVGGGKLDLFVEDAILIENKFHSSPIAAVDVAPAAGMQGRRYAISLGSQVVIVVAAFKAQPGKFPNKAGCISVKPISSMDRNRVEIRFTVPFGAVVPSSEKSS